MNGCTAHSISADNVEALILASVKRFSRFVLKDEETFALELQSLWKEKREEKPKQNQSELKRCQKRYDELSALIRSLYENLMSGLLPERQYKQLMAQYDSEQAELESQMETMKSEIAEDKSSSADIRHFISLIRKCKIQQKSPIQCLTNLSIKSLFMKPRVQAMPAHKRLTFISTMSAKSILLIPRKNLPN